MGFAPGPGTGGSSSIAGSTDVSLNSPQNSQVLTFNSSSTKWQNEGLASLPNAVLATSGTTRPTSNPNVTVIFKGADPGSNALSGDIWLGAD